MKFITDFADQAVILPLVVVIAIGLWVQGWRRGAVAWITAIGATFSVVLVLKLMFIACGQGDIRSPSGHVAAAIMVTGGLGVVLRRTSVLPLAILCGAVIGVSRLMLGVHSLPEVMIGAAVGLMGAIAMIKLAGRVPETLKIGGMVVTGMVVVLALHGLHLPAEAHIKTSALRLLYEVCR